jgi:hypothetical protein
MKIINHEVNGLQIGQRREDGYINLTKMAKANGKKINDYLRLETTKAFIDELFLVAGIPVSKIIQVKKGRGNRVGVSKADLVRMLLNDALENINK